MRRNEMLSLVRRIKPSAVNVPEGVLSGSDEFLTRPLLGDLKSVVISHTDKKRKIILPNIDYERFELHMLAQSMVVGTIKNIRIGKPPYHKICHPLGNHLEVPCRGEPKFGFGCPICELRLMEYPEDRNEGGIE